ncbi:thioredoxin reductase [Plantactinospora sp. GCM10030261]|uniref:thioredoxin reductase n=1 Tax=Plantactinospora sp. GCM10030261 TaxID=3273420 RepID=UPI0036219CA7
MRELRDKMVVALGAADLNDPQRRRAAEICAEIAERHCNDLWHVAQSPAGEIAELAGGEPSLSWSPRAS